MLQRTLPAGFIAPCLPTKTDKLPSGGLWLHEIKHDGFRIIARKDGQRVRLYSRPGNDFTRRFPLIVETLARLLWRKQNLATINRAEQAQAHWRRISAPDSPLRWSDSDRAKVDAAIQAARDQAVKDLGEAFRLVEVDDTASVECLLKELEIEERLDALIDKCLKRLLLGV